MDRLEIIGRISAAASELIFRSAHKKRVPIFPHSRLVDDLGADSLNCIEIVLEVEIMFDVEISDAEAEGAFTIDHLADLVERKVAARG